jgi:hypothetical protein
MSVSEFPPVVPFASYSEYEHMLDCLIQEYQTMVVDTLERTARGFHYHEGLGWTVRVHWLEQGKQLFMKFTKGRGKEWCSTVNTMVVHSLHTAVRVLVQTRRQMNKPLSSNLSSNLWDKLIVSDLLKQETELAIANRQEYPNNMYDFDCRNFRFILDDNYEDEWGYYLTVGQVQGMELAFAMISHPRLGCAAAGRILGYDTIKLVLANFSQPRK